MLVPFGYAAGSVWSLRPRSQRDRCSIWALGRTVYYQRTMYDSGTMYESQEGRQHLVAAVSGASCRIVLEPDMSGSLIMGRRGGKWIGAATGRCRRVFWTGETEGVAALGVGRGKGTSGSTSFAGISGTKPKRCAMRQWPSMRGHGAAGGRG